jgi:parvulin-like peptidyl-prolyl isomerase
MATKTIKPVKKTTKKITPRNRSLRSSIDTMEEDPLMTNMDTETPEFKSPKRPQFFKIALIVLVVAGVAALLLRNRGWFMAATVNGAPIPRWELNNRLTQRYGSQLLEAIIGEKLITSEAQKQGVTIPNEEIQARVAEIEKSLNGSMKLEDALKLQGISKGEFESQVRVQLLIDKMLSKEVSVSAQEVDEYLKSNSPTLTASDPAQRREQAEKEVRSNKISEKFQEWFAELKKNAKINRYL